MLLLPRPEIQLPSPHPADKLHLLQDIRHHVTTRTGQGIPLPSWKDSSGRGPRHRTGRLEGRFVIGRFRVRGLG